MTPRLRKYGAILVATLAGSAAALAAPMVSGDAPRASADPLCSTMLEQAIFEATRPGPGQNGENTGQDSVGSAGLACNPYLYKESAGGWANQAQANADVLAVLNRCGNTYSGRLLVLAIIETTGIRPATSGDNLCHQYVYDTWVDDVAQGGGTINWNEYSGNPGVTGPGQQYNVHGAVQGVMQTCNRTSVSHAVTSVSDHYPRNDFANAPTLFVSSELGLMGQCNPTLYRSAAWASYADLRSLVQARASSATNCSNAQITTAYQDITGWRSLPGECNAFNYQNGNWSSLPDLRNKVYHSLRCADPLLGQFYAYDIGTPRRVRGSGDGVGECNLRLYDDTQITNYVNYRTRVVSFIIAMDAANAAFSSTGNLTVGATTYRAESVLLASSDPSAYASTANGTNFIATSGGNVIASGGGNVIASGGGNVIASGGGNVIASGGGNIISEAGGALIGQAGTN